MLSFIILQDSLFNKIISAFDNIVYGFISGCRSEVMTRFMKFITFLGSGWALIFISLVILVAAFSSKRKKYFLCGLMVSVNFAAGALLNYILKQLFHRRRPDLLKLIEIGGYSFPSGHSMSSMIFYGFLIYLSIRYLKSRFKFCIVGVLELLIIAIGVSRIYLGVHYASDVLGGFIFGLGWLFLFIRIFEKHVCSLP